MTHPLRRHGDQHRTSLGEAYLLAAAIGCLAVGLGLLLLPDRLTTGPSVVTLYSLADRVSPLPARDTWGIVWSLLAALCGYGAWRPTEGRFIAVLAVLAGGQTTWAVGLTLPALHENAVTNILVPIAWLQIASTAAIVVIFRRRPVLPGHVPLGR